MISKFFTLFVIAIKTATPVVFADDQNGAIQPERQGFGLAQLPRLTMRCWVRRSRWLTVLNVLTFFYVMILMSCLP